MRADLQLVVDKLWIPRAMRFVGLNSEYDHEVLRFTSLLQKGRYPKVIGPLQYEDMDVGEAESMKCLLNGLILFNAKDCPCAILISLDKGHYGGPAGVHVEIAVPSGEKFVAQAFKQLEDAVNASQSYRGEVLSLETAHRYSGVSSGIMIHKLHQVTKNEVILPEKILKLLERNIVQFTAKRARLKQLGMSAKKGILFYGPPGTGKTHTLYYLAHCLPEHTTLLVTAEQVGLLSEYFALARLLQPSILVIEDVDLIARDRAAMDSVCEEVLLNQLLNEMDGLREDADIFFILTTNRPASLETALASRPGRIAQAVEFPLPDGDARQRLIQLYSANLRVPNDVAQMIVDRTKGVSAAFIKELMRRAAQFLIESDQQTSLTATAGGQSIRYHLRVGSNKILATEHVEAALEEMLFQGGKLNVRLLGGSTQAS